MARQEREIRIDPDAVVALVDVFSSWRDLDRRTKRDLLRSFGIRIFITKIGRGRLHAERIQIRSLDEALIYKKMKRLNVELDNAETRLRAGRSLRLGILFGIGSETVLRT